MAIQLRRGNVADFDRSKMVDGEIAITKEGDIFYCYLPGNVKRLMTEEDLRLILNTSEEAYNALLETLQLLEDETVLDGILRRLQDTEILVGEQNIKITAVESEMTTLEETVGTYDTAIESLNNGIIKINKTLTNDVVVKNSANTQTITLASGKQLLVNDADGVNIAKFDEIYQRLDVKGMSANKLITSQPLTIQGNDVDVQKGVYTPVCYDSDGFAISNEHIEAKGSYYKIGKMVYTTAYVKFLTNTIQYRPGNVSVSLPFVAANTETTNNSGTNGTFLVTYKNLISNLGDQPQTVYGGAALWGGSNLNFVYTAGTGTGGRQYHMIYAQVGANTGQINYTGMYQSV